MELEEKLNYLKTIRDLKDYVKDNNCMLADAIKVALKQLTKQEKMIDLMSKHIRADDIDEDICQYEGICNEYECEECIKQYFEKKAEEGINGRNKSWRVYKRLC